MHARSGCKRKLCWGGIAVMIGQTKGRASRASFIGLLLWMLVASTLDVRAQGQPTQENAIREQAVVSQPSPIIAPAPEAKGSQAAGEPQSTQPPTAAITAVPS